VRIAAPVLFAPLAACNSAVDCLGGPLSPERRAFRVDLRREVHFSQCPGPPSPTSFGPRITAYYARRQAFVDRVGRSRLASDLAEARRQEEEWQRNVNEADCMIYREEMADEPDNVRAATREWAQKERDLAEAERRFERLDGACRAA